MVKSSISCLQCTVLYLFTVAYLSFYPKFHHLLLWKPFGGNDSNCHNSQFRVEKVEWEQYSYIDTSNVKSSWKCKCKYLYLLTVVLKNRFILPGCKWFTKMFAKATRNFVRETDSGGDLIPVSHLNASDKLQLLSLVTKRKKFWCWQKPKYHFLAVSLSDVLTEDKPIKPGKAVLRQHYCCTWKEYKA